MYCLHAFYFFQSKSIMIHCQQGEATPVTFSGIIGLTHLKTERGHIQWFSSESVFRWTEVLVWGLSKVDASAYFAQMKA